MILVLNCGSQSVKWKIFDENLNLISQDRKEYYKKSLAEKVLRDELKKIKNSDEAIKFIGHRVVHPICELAPLHNPFELLGIKAAKKEFKKAKHLIVFDTDFFKNLPAVSQIYPLPEFLRKKYSIRRFGFHGISHQYLTQKTSEILKKPLKSLNLITLHLGGGCSIAAIKNGEPIDTSMGFTPLEGLVMMSRAGDLDPGLLIFLTKKIGIKNLEKILNKESGLKAIAGITNFKKILTKKDKKSKLAVEIFVYRIKKYISAYFGVLKSKVDAIVFSGEIGVGLPKTRNLILKDLSFLKKTKILVIPTDEEYQIAKEIKEKWKKFFKKTQ